MRDYKIIKYMNNTHYTVNVTDSYGRQKSSFFRTIEECHQYVYEVWANEVPKTKQELQDELLSRAIAECVELDINRGVEPKLD